MSVHPIDPRTGRKVGPGHKGPKAYKVRWRDRDGKQRGQTEYTRADADALDLEKKRLRRAGRSAQVGGSVKLDDWRRRRWQRDYERRILAAGTAATYQRSWDTFVGPFLGHLTLDELTFDELSEWQNELLDEHDATVDQVLKARTALGSVLTFAVKAQVLPGSHLQLVPRPRPPHRDEVVPLAPLEVEQIRAQLTRPRDRIIVSLLAYAGLRPGELRALRWVDRRDRTLLVQRAANPDGSIKGTKTGSSRTVKILPALAEDLDAWSLVAPAGSRTPIIAPGVWTQHQWAAWRRNVWRPACERAGLDDPVPRPYDLRHSFASLLLAEGQSVLDVAAQLGHHPRMTLGVYGHVIGEYEGLAAQERPLADTEIRKAREQFPPRSQPDLAREAA